MNVLEYFLLNKKNTLIFLIVLISLNFFLASQYREEVSSVLWNGDDVFHINIAESFRMDKNFNHNYVSTRYVEHSSQEIMNKIPPTTDIPQGSKGPIYYMLLGTSLEVTSASQEDLYLYSSLFNFVLATIFIVLFFIFVNKRFDTKTAIISSLIVSLVPGFITKSVHVGADMLLYIFSISALFFLERKKSNYFLFGIFAGLAHLTHPLALTLVTSYLIYLLIKKEIKGSLIVFGTWVGILLPWLIRNWYEFGDIGKGVYIPFSKKISEFLDVFLPTEKNIVCCDQANIFNLEKFSSLTKLVVNSDYNFSLLINSEYLIIFILIFTGFVFFNFNFKRSKTILLIICGIILAYYSIFNFLIDEIILQIVSFFIIPPILIFILYKKKKNIFSKSLNRFQTYVLLFVYLHIIAMYYFATNAEWSNLGTRYFLFQLYIIVPLSIFGFIKIINKQIPKKNICKIILVLVIVLIVMPNIIMLIENNGVIDKSIFIYETENILDVNQEIKNSIQTEKIVASNYPAEIWFRTGLNSISLPHYIEKQENFERYIRYFNISHIVIYENIDIRYKNKITPETITNYKPLNFIYDEKKIGSSSIITVKDILNADISNPLHYVAKMNKLERLDRVVEANTIYKELRDFDSDTNTMEKICEAFRLYGNYEYAIYKCMSLLLQVPMNLNVIENLGISFANVENKKDVYETVRDESIIILQQYNKLLEESPTVKIYESWSKIIELIQDDSDYENTISKRMMAANKFYEDNELEKALNTVMPVTYVSDYKIDALELKARILAKMGNTEETLKTYDEVILLLRQDREKLKNINQDQELLEKERYLIRILNDKISVITSTEEEDDLLKSYYDMLEIDRFNPDTYMKIAKYYEEKGELKQALYNYEMALRLVPSNEDVKEKIETINEMGEPSN